MGYIGNTPAEKYQTLDKQTFSVSATTGYTLSSAVTSPQEIALFINNVRQNPNSSYSVSGTALTLSAATASGDTMYCVFLGKSVGTIAPALGSVTNTMLAGSIANAKLANSAITLNGSAVSLGGSATIGGGKIGQLVNFTTSSELSSTSSSYVDTNLVASITPSATSSKIYIQMFSLCGAERASAEASFQAKILRGSTDIWVGGSQQFHIYGAGTSNIQPHFGQTFLYIDSPSSTSTLTYKVQAKTNSGSTIKFQYQSTVGSLILMEVLA